MYKKDNRNTPLYQGRKTEAVYTGNIRLSSLNLLPPGFPTESVLFHFRPSYRAIIRQQATLQPIQGRHGCSIMESGGVSVLMRTSPDKTRPA